MTRTHPESICSWEAVKSLEWQLQFTKKEKKQELALLSAYLIDSTQNLRFFAGFGQKKREEEKELPMFSSHRSWEHPATTSGLLLSFSCSFWRQISKESRVSQIVQEAPKQGLSYNLQEPSIGKPRSHLGKQQQH